MNGFARSPLTHRSLALIAALAASGCFSGTKTSTKSSSSKSTTSTATVSSATPGGAKAARIIFLQSSTNGSFDAPSAGTAPGLGSGHQAVRVFNADGTLLANGGPTASAWPKWLSRVEIGVSGAANTAATNSTCARFADVSESAAECSFSNQTLVSGGGSGQATPCGAPAGYFRVSEYDCSQAAPTDGKGNHEDGVYIRAVFDRSTSVLGANENILAVLEYAASGLEGGPTSPSSCFSGSTLAPEQCSDMTWKTFLNKTGTETAPQPFMLLVPPVFGYVNTASPANVGTGGGGVSTRQIFLPLAGDSDLKVFQLSRIKTNITNAGKFQTVCAPNGAPANSAYCVGMVFVSLTFYRL